ncbi:MAG: DUF3093 domain-containing protein [Actinomycetes bacterium]
MTQARTAALPRLEPGGSTYRERVWAPLWMWVFTLGMAISMLLAFGAATSPTIGVATGVATGALMGYGLLSMSTTVTICHGELCTGRAHIPVGLLSRPVVLDPQQTAVIRGPGIRVDAFHAMHGWVSTAIRCDVLDLADPTPYWVVSTRRPAQLAAALRAAQTQALLETTDSDVPAGDGS